MSKENFRQYIIKLKPLIQLIIKSKPCFYKLKGINVPTFRNQITDWHMGDKMMALLEDLGEQDPSIHDIKIKFDSDIHKILKNQGTKANPSNKMISVMFPTFDKYITVKINVYPHIVMIDIGCSFKPFVYDLSGAFKLCALLGQIQIYLGMITSFSESIPDVSSWIVTHYHFGKDGKISWSGKSVHYTCNETLCGMFRFYTKKYSNGKMYPRAEHVTSPNRSFYNEIQKMLNLSSDV